jgi:hypothetical protein
MGELNLILSEALSAQKMGSQSVELKALIQEGLIFVNQNLSKSYGPAVTMHHGVFMYRCGILACLMLHSDAVLSNTYRILRNTVV